VARANKDPYSKEKLITIIPMRLIAYLNEFDDPEMKN